MDNVCHTLVGAALGEAGLKRHTRLGSATLMIAANLPDVDVLVFATDMPSVAFRRGWTHGLLGQALLPLVLSAIMLFAARTFDRHGGSPPIRARWLVTLSYIGVLSHVWLDLLNNYGVRLLAPFNWKWFYGDAVFIIDPWLWLILGGGTWLARRARSGGAARWGLVVAAVYIASMCVTARLARNIVLSEWRAGHAGDPRGLMVGPLLVTPLRREVIIDTGTSYRTGTFSWLPTAVVLDAAVVPKNDDDPRVARAREAPHIRAFLVWSRFPFWTFEPAADGTRVSVADMRFAGREGSFVQSVIVR